MLVLHFDNRVSTLLSSIRLIKTKFLESEVLVVYNSLSNFCHKKFTCGGFPSLRNSNLKKGADIAI